MALLRKAGRTALNVGKEVLKTPVRTMYSLIDTPRVLMGKKPLPPVDLGYGLGTAQSAQRRALQLQDEKGYSGGNAALRAGSEAVLDIAGLAGAAGAATNALRGGGAGAVQSATPHFDKADDIMRETDRLLRANPVTSAMPAAAGVSTRAGTRMLRNAGKHATTGMPRNILRARGEVIPRQNFVNAHKEDVQEMMKFIDDVRLPNRAPTNTQQVTATRLAERFGLNPNQSPARIANLFAKRLEKNPQMLRGK